MFTLNTDLTICICEGQSGVDHAISIRPEHYTVSYEFSGSDAPEFVRVLTRGLDNDVEGAMFIVSRPPGMVFAYERPLIGDASLRNLCLELLNYALGLSVDYAVVIESCTLTQASSGLSYTQIAS